MLRLESLDEAASVALDTSVVEVIVTVFWTEVCSTMSLWSSDKSVMVEWRVTVTVLLVLELLVIVEADAEELVVADDPVELTDAEVAEGGMMGVEEATLDCVERAGLAEAVEDGSAMLSNSA